VVDAREVGDLNFWVTCAGMVAVTFGSRLTGLTMRMKLPPFWLRFLHFVPIAVFAALVTPSLEGSRGEGGIRVAAAAIAAAVAWRSRQLALAIGAGMVAFWLLRLLPG
jgi:branched-subunit amino acid transport protein